MKSDREIKEWIDSRDVLNEHQLQMFIYDFVTGAKHEPFYKWWAYALETKDKEKLRRYIDLKRYRGILNYELLSKIKDVYDNDIRLRQSSLRAGCKLLKDLYGIEITHGKLRNYLNIIKNELV